MRLFVLGVCEQSHSWETCTVRLSLTHTHTHKLTCRFALMHSGLILRASSLANLGLFVGQSLPKGTFITTYAGELISTSEACDRWARQKERGGQGEGNYVFCLREGEGRWNVDPTQIGGIGCVSFLSFCLPLLTPTSYLPCCKPH